MPPKVPAKPAAKTAAPAGKKASAKKGKAAPPPVEPKTNPLFVKTPRNFGIGNDIPPKRDLTRFVRWPDYVIRQRHLRILQRRLKVPPTINQFTHTIDVTTKGELLKLAKKYRPEAKKEKKERLRADAEAKAKDAKAPKSTAKASLKSGLQRVTRLIETKRAKLVLIAHDVDPIEIVIWLPALCRKMDVPYMIVKGKALLGRLSGFKRASCLAFTNVKSEDKPALDKLAEAAHAAFNDKYEDVRRHWGGLQMGRKAQKKAKALASEKKE
jgi:large subunit ribosomal protein L7Ae